MKEGLTKPLFCAIIQTDKRKGSNPMKTEIIEVLRQHPNGLRLREIAMYLRVNRFSIINIMDEMKKEGIIDGRSNDDHANGEYYIIWYLVK